MELEPGFKLSDAGSIPDDWESVPLGHYGLFRSGDGFPLGYQDQGGELPFYKVGDLAGDGLNLTHSRQWISDAARRKLRATVFPVGAIVFAKIGAAIALERKRLLQCDACLDNNLMALICDTKRVAPRFAHAALSRVKLLEHATATSVPSLSGRLIGRIAIATPTLQEQRAIAKAAEDVDAWIASAEAEAAKLARVKAAVMDALLTPTTRLPGFADDWPLEVLGDHLEFKNGISKSGHYFGYGSPIVNYMDVFNRPHLALEELKGRVFVTEEESQRFSVRRGDVFFTRTSETAEEIGMASVAITDRPNVVFSGFVLRARPTTSAFDSLFLGYVLRTGPVRRQIETRATYTTRALTNGGMLSLTRVACPPLPEQRAIAAVLSDIDAALDAAGAVVAKARGVKGAAMDALLSGRVRLPPFTQTAQPSSSAALEAA